MSKPLQPCGTEAAYRRHLYHKEQPCEACKKASRADWKQRQEKKKDAQILKTLQVADTLPVLDEKQILEETLKVLRAQLQDAPPQAVASIAKGIRDTLEALRGDTEKQGKKIVDKGTGGLIDEIARARAKRKERIANTAL